MQDLNSHRLIGTLTRLLLFGFAWIASASATQLQLTWADNSDNEDGFVLQRRTLSGPYVDLGVVRANTTVYTDVDLPAGTNFFYRVASYNQYGRSLYSRPASATVSDLSPVVTSGPAISAIASRSLAVNQPSGPILFTVASGVPSSEKVALTVVSSNPWLLPAKNLMVSGTGAAWTLQAAPRASVSGTAVITVVASNSERSSSSSFVLTVGEGTTNIAAEPPAGDRFYFGTTGSGGASGVFCLVLHADRSASLAIDGPGLPQGFTQIPLRPDAGGEFGINLQGVGRIRGIVTPYAVAGAIGSAATPFSGLRDDSIGPWAALVGVYRGAVAGTADDSVFGVIGPSGRALVAITRNGFLQAQLGDFSWLGTWSGERPLANIRELRLHADSGVLLGTLQDGPVLRKFGARREGRKDIERLRNVSVRGELFAAGDEMLTGFTLGGSGSRSLVIRAVGPTLGLFGVPNALMDPLVELFRQDSSLISPIEVNDDWDHGGVPLSTEYGGFPLDLGSKDAALAAMLPVGGFTARVKSADGGTGAVLVEVYDADPADGSSSARLSNISLLTRLGKADSRVIGGFSVTGEIPRRLLIRAVGPELAGFGVGDAMKDPILKLYGADSEELVSNDNLGLNEVLVPQLGHRVGAFPLSRLSTSASLVIWVSPGVYTAHVHSADGTPGTALLEIYEVPQ